MKNWLKEHKIGVILSSVITLLPMLFGVIFWNELPDVFATHWSADGSADGFMGKALAVFLLPGILFLLNVVCFCFTALDRGNREQSPKVMGMILWIMPMISLTINGIMYSTALDREFGAMQFLPVLLGLLLVITGNYLPKTRRNRTIGIKISWTMNNDENWNKTHRLSGKLYVAAGLLLIVCAFLPVNWMIPVLLSVLFITCLIPFVYSYCIYRKHKKQGIVYMTGAKSKAEQIAMKLTVVLVPLILVGCTVVMFTGNVEIQLKEESLTVDATYWHELSVEYEDIDSVEYFVEYDIGYRQSGFGSARLSLGNFENEAHGKYTLYSYNGCDAMIIIKSQGKVLALNGRSATETYRIYQNLLDKVN